MIRLGLAIVVMISHLVPGWWPTASWAVLVFYALSGYLSTLLLQKQSFKDFWIGRLLRVYPAYWVVLVGTLILFWLGPCRNPVLCSYMGTPDLWQWLGIVRNETPRVVPPFWAITVELFWWAALSLGLAKSRWIALIWLGLSLTIFPWAYPTGPLWFSVLGGAAPFALGSVAYWQGCKLPRDTGWQVWASALSYPVFLVHFAVGAVIPLPQGWPLFFAALAPTLALSWLLVVAVERPVAKFRQQLRQIHGH